MTNANQLAKQANSTGNIAPVNWYDYQNIELRMIIFQMIAQAVSQHPVGQFHHSGERKCSPELCIAPGEFPDYRRSANRATTGLRDDRPRNCAVARTATLKLCIRRASPTLHTCIHRATFNNAKRGPARLELPLIDRSRHGNSAVDRGRLARGGDLRPRCTRAYPHFFSARRPQSGPRGFRDAWGLPGLLCCYGFCC